MVDDDDDDDDGYDDDDDDDVLMRYRKWMFSGTRRRGFWCSWKTNKNGPKFLSNPLQSWIIYQ